MPTLRLHIERLVLEGLPFSGHGAALFQASLEAELARLAGKGDFTALSLPSGSLRSLPAAEFAFDTAAGPVVSGRQAAAALYRRLNRGTPHTAVVPERHQSAVSRLTR